jgi:predicted short-subunit dehydrogenase-like oxidoreductase (DUF2520 family)
MKKTVAILGAGRVGRELGRQLRRCGWRIGAVVARRPASARAAVRWIGAGKAAVQAPAEALSSDLVLITAPDRAIAKIAEELAGRGAAKSCARTIVLHTSGSLDHTVLAPLAARGAAIGAMHPMQTFGRQARADLRGAVFGLDGVPRAVRLARRIAQSLGGMPVVLNRQRKVAYHCAGGFAAQHVLAVVATGARLLQDAGVPRRAVWRTLCNMAHQTLRNVEQHGATAAWSGPLARGDVATVARHVAVLRRYPPEFLVAYDSLTRLLVRLVAAKPTRLLRSLRSVR